MGWALGTTAALAASIWFARRAIKTAISDEFDEDETAI
jgi:hypothetical protein